MKKQFVLGITTGLGIMLLAGCSLNPIKAITGDDVKSYDVVVESDDAKQLEVALDLGAGEMHVSGGSDEWITGEIEYNKNKLKPDVAYNLDGGTGKVFISQEKNLNVSINIGENKNGWDLQLTDEIPMALEVNAGASDTSLDLRGIQLTDLTVDAGVGDIEVDLSGDWDESFDATIHTGIGETTVILPNNVGVEVEASKGIGATNFKGLISNGEGVYVNEAYDNAEVFISIEVEMGIGEVNFEVEK